MRRPHAICCGRVIGCSSFVALPLHSVIPGRRVSGELRCAVAHLRIRRLRREILRCAIAHHSSPFGRPGMTPSELDIRCVSRIHVRVPGPHVAPELCLKRLPSEAR